MRREGIPENRRREGIPEDTVYTYTLYSIGLNVEHGMEGPED